MGNEDLVYIAGTSGKKEYLVVYKEGGVCLAVKPLVTPLTVPSPLGQMGVTFVGMRIRAVLDTDQETEDTEGVVQLMPKAKQLENMFKSFNLQQKSDSHASNQLGVCINPVFESLEQFREFIQEQDVVSKVMAGFTESMGDRVPAVSFDTIKGILTELCMNVSDTLCKENVDKVVITAKTISKPQEAQSKSDDNTDNVLDFQAAALKKFKAAKPDSDTKH